VNPADEKECPDLKTGLNPDSLEVLRDCLVEPALAEAGPGERFQFLRMGYFCVDSKESKPGAPVFNRAVTLRDTWAKVSKKKG
jgi:glutaminyl-tRNA synthetase